MTPAKQLALDFGGLPESLRPMLATNIAEAFEAPGWLFEPKWGGLRALAYIAKGQVALRSADGTDVTEHFPDVAQGLAEVVTTDGVVLDGELVGRDASGSPRLAIVTARLQGRGSGQKRRVIHYQVSDLLYHAYRPMLGRSLTQRRELLQQCIVPNTVTQITLTQDDSGTALFEAATLLGLEGVYAKRKESPYQPGQRSKSWLLIREQRVADLAVGGYTVGPLKERFASLLLGAYENGRLQYVGSLEGGFSQEHRRALYARLPRQHVRESPFAESPHVQRLLYWCEPKVVVRVKYGDLSPRGLLRFALFSSIVHDADPRDCGLNQF